MNCLIICTINAVRPILVAGQAAIGTGKRNRKVGRIAGARSCALAVLGAVVVLAASSGPAAAVVSSALALPLAGINIDGDLSDWPQGMPTQAILNDFQVYGATDLEGQDLTASQDLTAVMRVGYDANMNWLYLAVEVRDDVNINPRSANYRSTDNLEVYVSGLMGDAAAQQPTKYVMVPGVHQMRGYRGNPAISGGAIGGTRTRAAWQRHGDITTYEWRIDVLDRQDQRMDLDPGGVIGFDVVVVDADGRGHGSTAWVPWGPPVRSKWLSNDRLGRLVLGGGASFGPGMTVEPKWLLKSAIVAHADGIRSRHLGGDAGADLAAHGFGKILAGLIAGVQGALDDDRIAAWMRQEGATEAEIAEMRAEVADAQLELADARAELAGAHEEIAAELMDLDVAVHVDHEAINEKVRSALIQARVAQTIARTIGGQAIAAADARTMTIPPIPPIPPVEPLPDTDGDSGGDSLAQTVWSSVLGLLFLLGAIGVTVLLSRRAGPTSGPDPAAAVARIENIEQRLTDTQDVVIALSEKLDRLDASDVES